MRAPLSVLLFLSCASFLPSSAVEPAAIEPGPVFHCQVPCGIYGDQMRIDMLMEDAATIEKAMQQLGELGQQSPVNYNQVVRWVTTKDEHAQHVQQMVLDYWLAQRIKAPADGGDAAATEKYHGQLAALHGIIVSAMKCKQTTEVGNVAAIREKAMQLAASYFSAEDLKHIREHHAGEHK